MTLATSRATRKRLRLPATRVGRRAGSIAANRQTTMRVKPDRRSARRLRRLPRRVRRFSLGVRVSVPGSKARTMKVTVRR